MVTTQLITFTGSGTWTCPSDVSVVLLNGFGGGGGGGSGVGGNANALGGSGGGGALRASAMVSVVPGTTYNITIGVGGTGGTGGMTASSGTGGSATVFYNGSNILFTVNGGGGGSSSASTTAAFTVGGLNTNVNLDMSETNDILNSPNAQACGGNGCQINNSANAGYWNEGFNGGANTPGVSYGGGSGGGGGGANGVGGNGGMPGNGVAGSPGASAAANSGAGGGGGGGTVSSNAGGSGGNGGSGQLSLMYWV